MKKIQCSGNSTISYILRKVLQQSKVRQYIGETKSQINLRKLDDEQEKC